MSKRYKWHKIADSRLEIHFPANGLVVIEAAGKKITLSLWQDQLRGFAHKCPHAGGIFCDGFMDALGNVVCPLHRYKFSITNGRNTSGEGYYMKTYPIEERADGIFVGFEEGGLLNWW
jgi:nitrite reductase/ring-hydroxylating ferredoxin subunit